MMGSLENWILNFEEWTTGPDMFHELPFTLCDITFHSVWYIDEYLLLLLMFLEMDQKFKRHSGCAEEGGHDVTS